MNELKISCDDARAILFLLENVGFSGLKHNLACDVRNMLSEFVKSCRSSDGEIILRKVEK